MKHIVVDLEMNKVVKEYRNLGCAMETIEIGAIMLNENFQEISSFRTYVKPEYNTRITSIVRDLAGITYDMVINAPKFDEAIKMFSNRCLGVDDARNTAKLFHIFKDRELFDNTLSKIAEAMRPTDFGTSLGSLFDLSSFAVA
ncbi:MAG: exonuclease domain-containing protein [Lachnoanaerobaculum sp.]|nr:exonuclease domain-containing protein [Lachnoanaerobaculum sp.]